MCKLTFAGVMLFVTKEGPFRILLPDAELTPPREGKHDVDGTFEHVDGFSAACHYPRLVVERQGRRELHSLQYTKLTITSEEAGEPEQQGVTALADLSTLGLALSQTGYSCEVVLSGRFTSTPAESTGFRFQSEYISDRVIVEATRVDLALGRTVGETSISLTGEDKAWVLSSDVPLPPANLDKKMKVSKGFIDHDFKWLYSLLQPVEYPSLKTWLTTKQLEELPAPEYQENRSASVSTCFPGHL